MFKDLLWICAGNARAGHTHHLFDSDIQILSPELGHSSGGILTNFHRLTGEALDIYQIIELTKGSLEKRSQPGP